MTIFGGQSAPLGTPPERPEVLERKAAEGVWHSKLQGRNKQLTLNAVLVRWERLECCQCTTLLEHNRGVEPGWMKESTVAAYHGQPPLKWC